MKVRASLMIDGVPLEIASSSRELLAKWLAAIFGGLPRNAGTSVEVRRLHGSVHLPPIQSGEQISRDIMAAL